MSNVSDIYTLWLKPWHLPAGKPISVTIEKVETRTIHPRPTEERTALILTFAGKNRKLILNDGNANKMTDIGGEDWTAWRGLVIQLKRAQFTKDKETIYILPDTGGLPTHPKVTTSEPIKQSPASPVKASPHTQGGPSGPTLGSSTGEETRAGNGHTDQKPYRFPSTAAAKFFDEVQATTGNHYEDGAALEKTLGGWFNFANTELWNERLSFACDMARQPA